MKQYVTGYLFDENLKYILLIKKINPSWQYDFLNGIGGKIEANETPTQALTREFKEETNLTHSHWTQVATIQGIGDTDLDDEWINHHLCSCDNSIFSAIQLTQEQLVVLPIKNLTSYNILPSLRFIIPLCLDRRRRLFNFSDTFTL